MEEQNSVEVSAPSVTEAIASGLQKLGLREDQVGVTVLSEEQPGPARVRLTALERGESGSLELDTVQAVVEEIIDHMHLEASLRVHWVEPEGEQETRHAMADIHGQDLGIMVSHRGEALGAFQYLTRLIVARRLGTSLPVILDIDGYRQKREQQLMRMARRAADQAVERNRTVALEPMPANERRIIHIALREYPGVITESIGIGRQRKVTIIPKPPAESAATGVG